MNAVSVALVVVEGDVVVNVDAGITVVFDVAVVVVSVVGHEHVVGVGVGQLYG